MPSTPKGLHNTVRGREAHPGLAPTRDGLAMGRVSHPLPAGSACMSFRKRQSPYCVSPLDHHDLTVGRHRRDRGFLARWPIDNDLGLGCRSQADNQLSLIGRLVAVSSGQLMHRRLAADGDRDAGANGIAGAAMIRPGV